MNPSLHGSIANLEANENISDVTILSISIKYVS